MPNTGPSDGSRRHRTGDLPIAPSPGGQSDRRGGLALAGLGRRDPGHADQLARPRPQRQAVDRPTAKPSPCSGRTARPRQAASPERSAMLIDRLKLGFLRDLETALHVGLLFDACPPACRRESSRQIGTTDQDRPLGHNRAPITIRRPDRGPRAMTALDLLELGQQVLGHADRRGVDQAAVERHGALPGGGLPHRGDDPVGAVDQARLGVNTSLASAIWMGGSPTCPRSRAPRRGARTRCSPRGR